MRNLKRKKEYGIYDTGLHGGDWLHGNIEAWSIP